MSDKPTPEELAELNGSKPSPDELAELNGAAAVPPVAPEPSFGEQALSAGGDLLNSAADKVVQASNPVSQVADLVTKPGLLADKLRAAQNGLSWGTAPKIAAGLSAAAHTIGHGIAPDTVNDQSYADALAEQQPLYAKASHEHPAEDFAASMYSGGPEVKAAGFLGRGLKFGLNGLAQTASRMWGESPKEGVQAFSNPDAVRLGVGVGLPAAVGVATGPWGRVADDMALRATGLKGGITNKLQNMGYETADDARELGNAIRKSDLVPWFGDGHDVADRAAQLEKTSGQRIGSAIDAADASGVKPDFQSPVVAARKGLMRETPVLRQAGGKLRDFLDTLEKTPSQLVDENGLPRPATFRDLNSGKSDAWKSANMSTEAQGAAPLYRQGVGRVRDDLQRQVEAAAGPQVAKDLAEGNRQFGLARDVKRITNDVNTRDAHKFGLPEVIAAAGGGVLGGASLGHGAAAGGIGSAATVLATRLARQYGPAFLTRLAQAVEPASGAISSVNASSLADYLAMLNEEKDNP